MATILSFPSPERIRASELCKQDRFFKAPEIIETFIQRANQELEQYGITAEPWTINCSVTLFKDGEAWYHVPYETIEDDIAWSLDRVAKHAKEAFLNSEKGTVKS
jgi:hypothetical protein